MKIVFLAAVLAAGFAGVPVPAQAPAQTAAQPSQLQFPRVWLLCRNAMLNWDYHDNHQVLKFTQHGGNGYDFFLKDADHRASVDAAGARAIVSGKATRLNQVKEKGMPAWVEEGTPASVELRVKEGEGGELTPSVVVKLGSKAPMNLNACT